MRRSTVLVGLWVLTAGSLLAFFLLQTRATRRQMARLGRCYLGAPIAPGESPLRTLHRIELAERQSPSGAGDDAWPQRCQPLLSAVASSRAVPDRLTALAARARGLQDPRRPTSEPYDASSVLNEALEELLLEAQTFASGATADDVPAPRAPVVPLLDREEPGVRARCAGFASFDPYRLDPQPLDRVGFEAGAPRDPRFCELYGSSGDKAQCRPMPPELMGMHLVASGKPERFVFGSLGGFRSLGGEELAAGTTGRATPERAFLTASGAAVKLSDPAVGDVSSEVRWLKGGQRIDLPVPASAGLVAGHVVWLDGGRLVVRRVLDEAPGFGPEQRVETAAGDALLPRLRACHHAQGWAVVVAEHAIGSGREFERDDLAVHLVDEGGWSGPQAVPRGEGEGRLGPWSLSCQPGSALVGWARLLRQVGPADSSRLTVARCTREGCASRQAQVSNLDLRRPAGAPGEARAEAPLLVPLGAAAALIWSDRHFVHARIADMEALDKTPTRTLAQVPAVFAAAEVFTRGDTALLMIRTGGSMPSPFFPFRLDRQGAQALDCAPAL